MALATFYFAPVMASYGAQGLQHERQFSSNILYQIPCLPNTKHSRSENVWKKILIKWRDGEVGRYGGMFTLRNFGTSVDLNWGNAWELYVELVLPYNLFF